MVTHVEIRAVRPEIMSEYVVPLTCGVRHFDHDRSDS